MKGDVDEQQRQPWSRQPDESGKAFSAFQKYLALDGERSHVRVAGELGKSVQLINRWSRRHGWVERCRAFDSYQHQELLDRRIRMRDVAIDALIRDSRKVVAKALRRLDALHSNKLSARVAAQMFSVGARVLLQGLGGAPTPEQDEKPQNVTVIINRNRPRDFETERRLAAGGN